MHCGTRYRVREALATIAELKPVLEKLAAEAEAEKEK